MRTSTLINNRRHFHLLPDDLYTLWQHSRLLGVNYWMRHRFGCDTDSSLPLEVHYRTYIFPQLRVIRLEIALNGVCDIVDRIGQDQYDVAARNGNLFLQYPLPTWVVCRLIRSHWVNVRSIDSTFDGTKVAKDQVMSLLRLEENDGPHFWGVLETFDPHWNDQAYGIIDKSFRPSRYKRNMYWICHWPTEDIDRGRLRQTFPGWKSMTNAASNMGWSTSQESQMMQRFKADVSQTERIETSRAFGSVYWWSKSMRQRHSRLTSVWLFATSQRRFRRNGKHLVDEVVQENDLLFGRPPRAQRQDEDGADSDAESVNDLPSDGDAGHFSGNENV